MDCPKCGQENSESEVSCSSCGCELSLEAAFRELEALEKEIRRGRTAAVASIVCFCVPIVAALAWFLFLWHGSTQPQGCAGVGIIVVVIMAVGSSICVGAVTGAIGTALAAYAVSASKWRRGKLGLFLNIILLLAIVLAVLIIVSQIL